MCNNGTHCKCNGRGKARRKERKREREKERKKERERKHTATTHLLYQSHISSPCPDETTHRSTDREVCRILHSKSPATKQASASINVVCTLLRDNVLRTCNITR